MLRENLVQLRGAGGWRAAAEDVEGQRTQREDIGYRVAPMWIENGFGCEVAEGRFFRVLSRV